VVVVVGMGVVAYVVGDLTVGPPRRNETMALVVITSYKLQVTSYKLHVTCYNYKLLVTC
jgi:hypothetical protein